MIIYLVSFFYIEKSLHLLDDTQTVKTAMLSSLVGFFAIYLSIWIYDMKVYQDLSSAKLCSTLVFVIPASLNCLISFGALAIGYFIHLRL